jgi:hypothetical protein
VTAKEGFHIQNLQKDIHMDDLFGSDDDQQSELNDIPSPHEVASHSDDRISAEDNAHGSPSDRAAKDDLYGSDEENDNEKSNDAGPVRKR